MGGWWYEKDGRHHGPHTVEDLGALLRSDAIAPRTRVWRKGMDGATEMSEAIDLQDLIRQDPPPIGDDRSDKVQSDKVQSDKAQSDGKEAPAPLRPGGPAGPWARFLARQIDLALFGSVAWLILWVVIPGIQPPEHLTVTAVLSLPMALLIEAPVLALFGGTPGKAIFGITVRRNDNSRLSLPDALRRSTVLWTHGFGLGLPVVSIIFLIISYRNAKAGARNAWDKVPMHTVWQAPVGNLRWAVGLLVAVGLCGGLTALEFAAYRSAMHHAALEQPPSPAELPAFTWTNPHTGSTARIPPGWRPMPEKESANPGTAWFAHTQSLLILGKETIPGVDLDLYTEALRKATDYGALETRRVETDANGLTVQVLTHRKLADGVTYRVEVRVWQTTPTDYWRTVAFMPPGNQPAWLAATDLAGVLANSSLDLPGRAGAAGPPRKT